MIYTITVNPCLDNKIYIKNGDVKIGKTNIADSSELIAGGKGINVSRALDKLHVRNVCTMFIGQGIGAIIEDKVSRELENSKFCHISGDNRINTKVYTCDGVLEINTNGTLDVKSCDIERLLDMCDLKEDDTVIISGSTVKCGVLTNIVANIRHKHNTVRIIIDNSSDELLDVLGYNIEMIKPNYNEFKNIFKGYYNDNIIKFMDNVSRYLNEKDVNTSVVITMDKNGAIIVDRNGAYNCSVPEIVAVDDVGAGDSVVAGYVYMCNKGEEEILNRVRYALAYATNKAATQGFPDGKEVETYMKQVIIKNLYIK